MAWITDMCAKFPDQLMLSNYNCTSWRDSFPQIVRIWFDMALDDGAETARPLDMVNCKLANHIYLGMLYECHPYG